MSGNVVVLSTASSQAEASSIARALVERHLAACVNVVPGVTSTYRWEGKVHSDAEWLLIVKTRREKFDEVAAAIRELNANEVPEILMLDIAGGDPDYLAWLQGTVPF